MPHDEIANEVRTRRIARMVAISELAANYSGADSMPDVIVERRHEVVAAAIVAYVEGFRAGEEGD